MSVTLLRPCKEEKAIQLSSLQTDLVSLTVVKDGNHLSFSVVDAGDGAQYDFDLGEGREAEFALAFIGLKREEGEK